MPNHQQFPDSVPVVVAPVTSPEIPPEIAAKITGMPVVPESNVNTVASTLGEDVLAVNPKKPYVGAKRGRKTNKERQARNTSVKSKESNYEPPGQLEADPQISAFDHLIKEEQLLSFFIANRRFQNKGSEHIKAEWLSLKALLTPDNIDFYYKKEQLSQVVIVNRQALGFNQVDTLTMLKGQLEKVK